MEAVRWPVRALRASPALRELPRARVAQVAPEPLAAASTQAERHDPRGDCCPDWAAVAALPPGRFVRVAWRRVDRVARKACCRVRARPAGQAMRVVRPPPVLETVRATARLALAPQATGFAARVALRDRVDQTALVPVVPRLPDPMCATQARAQPLVQPPLGSVRQACHAATVRRVPPALQGQPA